jgi:Gas vesicle synthesis protein GvpO
MNESIAEHGAGIGLEHAIGKATEKILQLTGLKLVGVVGVTPDEEGNYLVKIEFVERAGIPDTMDILGLYEVNLDRDGNLISYSRVDMRKRGEAYKN